MLKKHSKCYFMEARRGYSPVSLYQISYKSMKYFKDYEILRFFIRSIRLIYPCLNCMKICVLNFYKFDKIFIKQKSERYHFPKQQVVYSRNI